MKIGLLSDAHGNPEGLANCIEVLRAKGADRLYFLGDAVGYLPQWTEVLNLLRENDVSCVLGNHDEHALRAPTFEGAKDAYQLTPTLIETLAPYRSWMESWPRSLKLEIDGMSMLLLHASPENELNGYVYPWTDLSEIQWPEVDLIAMGHTHRPFVRRHNQLMVINPGSCGLPRDVGHLASCAMLDTATRQAQIYRTPFEVERVLSTKHFIHPDVRSCLHRSQPELVGTIIPAAARNLQ